MGWVKDVGSGHTGACHSKSLKDFSESLSSGGRSGVAVLLLLEVNQSTVYDDIKPRDFMPLQVLPVRTPCPTLELLYKLMSLVRALLHWPRGEYLVHFWDGHQVAHD